MVLKGEQKTDIHHKHKTPFPSLLQDGMNFGFTKDFSSWNQPVCEEHFQPARGDETQEEIPKVEDLSIRGEGNLQELEREISEESCQEGGGNNSGARKGKNKVAKSRREREGDYDDNDHDEDDEVNDDEDVVDDNDEDE